MRCAPCEAHAAAMRCRSRRKHGHPQEHRRTYQPDAAPEVFRDPDQGARRPEALTPHLAAHLEYMIKLEKDGVLFASGPFAEPDGSQRGNGMNIVRAESAEHARKLAEADPFFTSGLRTFEVREWTVMEGSVGLTVNFSDQTFRLA